MKTKTLRTIQKISKVGKILSTIAFIFNLIGAIGCAAGIIALAVVPHNLRVGDLTLHTIIEKHADISFGTCYAAMAVGLILCAGSAVLAKFAKRYFANELEAGTPFTFAGAKELIRLGILTLCIPVGTTMIAGIVYEVMANVFSNVEKMHFSNSISIGLGIMFIITGIICRYGAEISTADKEEQSQ